MLTHESFRSSWRLQCLHSESFLCPHHYLNTKPKRFPKLPGELSSKYPDRKRVIYFWWQSTQLLYRIIYVKVLGILTLKEFKISLKSLPRGILLVNLACKGHQDVVMGLVEPGTVSREKRRRKNVSSSVTLRTIESVGRFLEKASGS